MQLHQDKEAFDELAPEVKNVFATYMNWLLEKEDSKKTTIK